MALVFVKMLALVALSFAAEEAVFTQNNHRDDIPVRCIENSVTPVSCAHQSSPDGLVAHPDDCALFYYCVEALRPPVCRQCPAGLHFNPALRVCDEPEDAGCRAGVARTTQQINKVL